MVGAGALATMWGMDRMAASLYPSTQRRFLLLPGGPVHAGSPGARIHRS
jgi:hypothetical protein